MIQSQEALGVTAHWLSSIGQSSSARSGESAVYVAVIRATPVQRPSDRPSHSLFFPSPRKVMEKSNNKTVMIALRTDVAAQLRARPTAHSSCCVRLQVIRLRCGGPGAWRPTLGVTFTTASARRRESR
ncbi:hypothetical protein SKAU_G00111900 [Synaphobranchus kaupii]|uniref:Uncharacterized protein n=1 Tax=Synaphobranchus kaupii TaxID=118154 RepID=A0A9Q1J7E7_SYNKA|nr:hypothetical protein SKAU_G00111900 [Synaphobranchus kaupii]